MSNKNTIVSIPKGEVYTASMNKEGFYCVDGPGEGLGYYAHTLNPGLSCKSEEEAKSIALHANVLFQKGQVYAANKLKSALMMDVDELPLTPNIELKKNTDGGTNVMIFGKPIPLPCDDTAVRFSKIMNIAFNAGESIRTRHVRSLLHAHDGVFE